MEDVLGDLSQLLCVLGSSSFSQRAAVLFFFFFSSGSLVSPLLCGGFVLQLRLYLSLLQEGDKPSG